MKPPAGMLLLLLTLAPLLLRPAEGAVLTKCGLKSQLDAAFLAEQPPNATHLLVNQTMDTLVGKIVCKAQQTGFNTSAVTVHLPPPSNSRNLPEPPKSTPGKKKPRSLEHSPGKKPEPTTNPKGKPEHPTNPKAKPEHPTNPKGKSDGQETFYGIFQLSDELACSNGVTPSVNICKTNCTSLTDDNISDDIACLLMLLHGGVKEHVTFPRGCPPAGYFSDC